MVSVAWGGPVGLVGSAVSVAWGGLAGSAGSAGSAAVGAREISDDIL